MKRVFVSALFAITFANSNAYENKQEKDKFLSRADLYYISTMLRSKPAELDQWDALLMLNGDQDSSIIYKDNSRVNTSIIPVLRYKNYVNKYVVTIYKNGSSSPSQNWQQVYLETIFQNEEVSYIETTLVWILIIACFIACLFVALYFYETKHQK